MDILHRQVIFLVVLEIFLSQTWVTSQDVQGNRPPNDQTDLRHMLKVALQQNRQLEIQNTRLRQVWTGLQHMCRAIQPCECPSLPVPTGLPTAPETQVSVSSLHFTPGQSATQETKQETTMEPQLLEPVETLKVVSISSSGTSLGIDDAINVTVYYTAPSDHTVEWIVFRVSGGMTRTSGHSGVYNDENNHLRRYTRMQFKELNLTRTAMLRFHSNEETIHIRLNLTKLESAGNQIIPEPDKDLVQFKSSYESTADNDLDIDVKVKGDVRDSPILAHSEIFFSGLNTSTNPHSVFEIFSLNANPGENGIGFVGQSLPNDTKYFNIKVTLKKSYVKYGGILTLRFPQSVSGYVSEFFTGKFVTILSPIEKTVVQRGGLGVFHLPPQTFVYSPSQSILCASMGNPLPEVGILKVMRNGSVSLQPTETLIKDRVSHVKSLTLLYNSPGDDVDGTYICRATNGNTTAETKTVVMRLQPVDFDDPDTGVNKRNPDDVVVTCQASGFPRPRLEIRLYDGYGPDLASSGLYTIDITTPSDMTSRMTLHLSPTDTDVHTVYCVALQDSKIKTRRMEVFPSTRINWELYNRLSRNQ